MPFIFISSTTSTTLVVQHYPPPSPPPQAGSSRDPDPDYPGSVDPDYNFFPHAMRGVCRSLV